MFDVKHKKTNKIYRVFAVDREQDGSTTITRFLFYGEKCGWYWDYSWDYEPVIIDFTTFMKSQAELMTEMQIETAKIINQKEGEQNA
jgi:hypothetical protein